MDPTLIETLLNMSESDVLDFKREQYLFANATDDQKSEIVKDIVAFANAWKTTDAYILLGVDENHGGRGLVTGVQGHINDADLQQLVNSKTNRPVSFGYIPVTVDGLPVGIIRVAAKQDRPIFLKKPFGKLKANTVYIRRGSSTAEAGLDEVARMGSSASLAVEPQVEVQLADPPTRNLLGVSTTIRSRVLEKPPPMPPMPEIYDASAVAAVSKLAVAWRASKIRPLSEMMFRPDPEKVIAYRKEVALLTGIGFSVRNAGTLLVRGLRIVLAVPKLDGLRVMEERPEEPTGLVARIYEPSNIAAVDLADTWEVTAAIGSVQPGATAFSDAFWIGSEVERELRLVARVYGDNIPRPADVPIMIKIEVEKGWLDEEVDGDGEDGDDED